MILVFLPPIVTSVVQPLDQGLIASFKIQYKKKLLWWVLSKYDDATLKGLRKVVPTSNKLSRGVMKYGVSWMHK